MRNRNRNRKLRRAAVVVILLTLAAAVPSILYFLGPERPGPADPAEAVPQTALPPPPAGEEPAGAPAPPGPVIDYGRLEEEGPLDDLMDRRMADLGIGESLDMVVRPEESIKVGGTTVPMSEILDKIRIRKGGIVEETLGPEQDPDRLPPGSEEDLYGIHVVRPGDNVWNIHFGFLKEYFAGRGVVLSPAEDEPDERGVSSGVGKILKFSENMVFIYNVREHRLEPNLHLIHPLSKIVVFNLGRMLSILRLLDFEEIDRVSYDGEILWIPPAGP